MIVPTSIVTPNQPISPKTTITGKTLGTSRIKPADRSRKTIVITPAIVSRS